MKKTVLCFAVLLAIVTHSVGWAASSTVLPVIKDIVARFYEERKRSTAPQISASDKAIIEKAKNNLAESMPAPGLKVGDKAPDFTLPDAFGQFITLSEELKKSPVVLVFYRGAWCPFCNIQLRAYQQSLDVIKQAGGSMIALSPQKPDRSRQHLEKTPLDFKVLSDVGSATIKAYKLFFTIPGDLSDVYKRNFSLDLAEYNGEGHYELPVPGTYIIDQSGIIRAAFADTDYTKRMEPQAIVDALLALRK